MKKHLKRLSVLMTCSLLAACATNSDPSLESQDSSLATTESSAQTSSTTGDDQNVVLLETHGELILNDFEGTTESFSPTDNVYNDHYYFSIVGGYMNSISYTAREYKLDLTSGDLTVLKGYPQNKVRVSDFIEFKGVLYEAVTDLNDPSLNFRILADGQKVWSGYGNPEFYVVNDNLLFHAQTLIEGQKTDIVYRINPDYSVTTLVQAGQDGLGFLFPTVSPTYNHSKLLMRSTQNGKDVYVLINSDGYEIIDQADHVEYESVLLEDEIFIAYPDPATLGVENSEGDTPITEYKYEAFSLSTKETRPVQASFEEIGVFNCAAAVKQSMLLNNPERKGVLKATLKNQELEVEEIGGIENLYYRIYPVDQQRALLVGFEEGQFLKPTFYLVNVK